MQRADGILSAGFGVLRERPFVVAATLAALIGAVLGAAIAGRRQPTLTSARRAAGLGGALRPAKTVKAGAGLISLAVRLISNPLVQHFLRRAIARELARRFGR